MAGPLKKPAGDVNRRRSAGEADPYGTRRQPDAPRVYLGGDPGV